MHGGDARSSRAAVMPCSCVCRPRRAAGQLARRAECPAAAAAAAPLQEEGDDEDEDDGGEEEEYEEVGWGLAGVRGTRGWAGLRGVGV